MLGFPVVSGFLVLPFCRITGDRGDDVKFDAVGQRLDVCDELC